MNREPQCRCCGESLKARPVLTYRNMPSRAQDFPEKPEPGSGITLEIYQCPYCGLIQAGGKPVPYYRDVIRAVGFSSEMREFRKEYFRRFMDDFELWHTSILEIGAGCGEYMELFSELGADVFGLEHRAASVRACLEKGLRVQKGFPEDSSEKLQDGPYGAFYTMSFLEHIPEPNSFLKCIANNLQENAVGLVEVPNTDFIIKNRIFSEFMQDHLSYFTEETLRLVLGRNGFEVLSCEPVWRDYILAATVRKRGSGKWDGFQKSREKLVGEIRAYAGKIHNEGKKLAVWGAGHEALAYLALADIGEYVEFVADSAPFKQNRYTPATNIAIVAPERIGTENIGAVLVMAGSYSFEIAELVRNRWPHAGLAVVNSDGVKEICKGL